MSELTERQIEPLERQSPGQRLLTALEMMALGIELRAAGERARHPDETEAEIERRVAAWLQEPEPVDIDFREVAWPLRRD